MILGKNTRDNITNKYFMGHNYKQINLPIPPQNLLDLCVDNVINNIDEFELKKNTIVDTPLTGYVHSPLNEAYAQINQKYVGGVYHVPRQLKDWLKENIHIDTSSCWIAAFKSGESCIPHVDKANRVSFNLLLTNSQAKTCWYKIKDEYQHLKFPEFGQFAQFMYNRLDLIESVVFKKNEWNVLKTDIPHSVENINNTLRIVLRFGSLDKEIFYKV